MPSARSTQPRLVTEPTTKPMLAAPRHSRMPTWTRCIGCCALAPVKDATSMVAAIPARMNGRRMKKSPADEGDASRESRARQSRRLLFYATTAAAVPDLGFLSVSSFRDGPKDQTSDVQLHIGESRDSGFALRAPRNDETYEKRPALRASFALALRLLTPDDDVTSACAA